MFSRFFKSIIGTGFGPRVNSRLAAEQTGKRRLVLETLEPRIVLAADLMITEIHYNPRDPSAGGDFPDKDSYEFIELKNISNQALDLEGIQFDRGVSFTFPSMILPAGARTVVVSNSEAFAQRYGAGIAIAGQYTDDDADPTNPLNNGGERIRLLDRNGQTIQDIRYNDAWFALTDGDGYSLVAWDENNPPSDPNSHEAWRTSALPDGSPGSLDGPFYPGMIVINEISSHTDTAPNDWIELLNRSPDPVDLAGWTISDSAGNPNKYIFPGGSIIAAGGYLTLTQDADFGALNPGVPFGLSELGEIVILAAPGPFGQINGDEVRFGASDRDVTFGRYYREDGSPTFVTLDSPSFGSENSEPLVGPIVISEIMYNPDSGEEYIELFNSGNSTVRLFDPAHVSNTWKFTSGILFAFPSGVTIAAGGYLLIVDDNPVAFRANNGVPPAVQVFSYEGQGGLSNNGETLELSRPGNPEPPPNQNIVPYYAVDRVTYNDQLPWPVLPDGMGPSLVRRSAESFGDDVASWLASEGEGSPGRLGDPIGPRVVGVRVSGSNWSGVPFEIPVGTGDQLTPLSWDSINRITLAFDEPIRLSAGAFELESDAGDVFTVTADVAVGIATQTVTWTLDHPIGADRLKIDLENDLVLDLAGNRLDGDWKNAMSTFPSGDGDRGTDFRFRFNVVPGDVDQNGQTTHDDLREVMRSQFTRSNDTRYDRQRDINADGVINFIDLILTRDQVGATLPVASPEVITPVGSPGPDAPTVDLVMPTMSTETMGTEQPEPLLRQEMSSRITKAQDAFMQDETTDTIVHRSLRSRRMARRLIVEKDDATDWDLLR